jgi:dipeptidase
VIPNYYTIGEIDLADTSNFLGAPDIMTYAIEKGWYEPARDGAFHFAQVYSDREILILPDNVNRMWRGVNLLANRNYSMDETLPFAFLPKKKLAVQDLFRVLRDHYEGTPLDMSKGYKFGSPNLMNGATICSESTQNSFVAQLRSGMPPEVGAVVWLSQRRPDTQAFVPWYLGIEAIPAGYAHGDWQSALAQHFAPPESMYDQKPVHAYWDFAALAQKIDEDYGQRITAVRRNWDKFELEALAQQKDFEKNVLKLFERHPERVRKMLTERTAQMAGDAWKIARELVKKY